MKLFKQFKEDAFANSTNFQTGGKIKIPPSLPGLGGGGGGTNAITGKAKTKTLGNYAKDAFKIATFPFSRKNVKPDPASKFADPQDTMNTSQRVDYAIKNFKNKLGS